MVFWGVEVKPGGQFTPSADEDGEYEGSRLHLSQATLGLDGKGKERTVVKCKVGDGPELLLCSLTPGVSESCSLDLLFDQDVVFSVAGSTSVHLVGYYMPLDDEEEDNDYEFEGSEFDSEDDFDDEDYDEDIDMGDEDVPPSSVTITELDDSGNPPMLEATPAKNKQTAPDSDQEHNKSMKKRKRAAAAKETAVAGKDEKKESLPEVDNVVIMSELSEDEDGFPLPSELTEGLNKSDPISTPATPSSESKKQKKKNKKNKKENELEKKFQVEGEEKTPKKIEKTPKKAAKENGSEVKASTTTPATKASTISPGANDASAKKAKKAGFGTRKFPNGLELEDIAMGKPDARQTKPGKRVEFSYIPDNVSVHYTGKLKSNEKIFDSSIGKKPLSFRLGVGEVVKGWDVGVAGMRIGDKRRITIPPAMGYGAKGTGPIPGNAWLVFDVEVVDVAK